MFNRRNLTPPAGVPAQGLPPTRRAGARSEVSDRVAFARDGKLVDGWALNVSRGGLRAIVEEPVELGGEYAVALGDAPPRVGRVVWIQEEPDGAIVGVSYLDAVDEAPASAAAPVTEPSATGGGSPGEPPP